MKAIQKNTEGYVEREKRDNGERPRRPKGDKNPFVKRDNNNRRNDRNDAPKDKEQTI